jgi:hypothetical protein
MTDHSKADRDWVEFLIEQLADLNISEQLDEIVRSIKPTVPCE